MPQFRPLSETKFINDANLFSYYPLEDLTDVKGGFNLTNNNSVALTLLNLTMVLILEVEILIKLYL